MLIKNLTIQNFQSYYGVTSIDFSIGLNLIIGNGGKGKSKLFNAFYWVLFGDIYSPSSLQELAFPKRHHKPSLSPAPKRKSWSTSK